jgi:DNA-binding beta-propeller fold protein YncE
MPRSSTRLRSYDPGMNRREFLALAAAAPFAVRSGAAFAMPAPLALVTCDTEARVAVVNVATGRIVRSIPVLPDPRSVERVGAGDALVCHTNVGALSIIDGRSLRVRHVLHDFVEPRYTAAHPDRRHAFVTDSGSKEVVAVDVLTGRSLGRLRLSGWARHLTLDPAGRTLWVGLGNVAAHVAVVDVSDPARPKFARRVTPPFLAHDVGFLPDGDHVWVTSGDEGKTAIYQADGEAHLLLSADAAPQHVTFGAGVAYVTSGTSGTFRVHSLRDGRALSTTPVPIGSYNVQFGAGGRVLTPSLNRGTLCVMDGRGRLLHEVHVAPSSHDACFVG